MSVNDLQAGIEILRKYWTNPDAPHVSAEDGLICFHPTDLPMSEEDVAALHKLGFCSDRPDGGWQVYAGGHEW